MGALIAIGIVAAAGVPLLLVLRSRIGAPAAIAVSAVAALGILLGALLLTAALSLPIVATLCIVVGAIAVVGVWLSVTTHLRVTRLRLSVWLPVVIGPLLWICVLLLAQLLPGASRRSWAMQGDSANNILFAREVIANNGVVVGASENPVPMPAALLAAAIDIGRSEVPTSALLDHDLAAFTVLWGMLIAMSGVMAAVLAGSLARSVGAAPAVVAISTALGSLVPFSWFVTGYATEFGFFNTHIALIVMAATVIVFLESSRQPSAALAVLTVAGTILLATWSPLVLVPGILGLVLLIRSWRDVLATPRHAAVVAVGIVQIGAYGVTAVLPGLVANGEALSAQGGVIAFSKVMLPALGATAIGFVAVASLPWARSTLRSVTVSAVVAVVVAVALGLSVLVVTAGGEWTYYPLKFAWLASALLVVVIVGLFIPAASALFAHPRAVAVIAIIATAGVLVFTQLSPTIASGERRQHPFARILEGNVASAHGGDAVANRIIELADTAVPRVLWKSGEQSEADINFWLVQMQVEDISEEFDLRLAAYEIGSQTETAELCSTLNLLGPNAVVLTRVETLEVDLAEDCPTSTATVEQLPPG